MSEIVSLRSVRKARDRKATEATAAENRAKFGRTKAQRLGEGKEAARVARIVDGAKIEDGA